MFKSDNVKMILFVVAFVAVLSVCSILETTYTKEGIIIQVKGNIVTIVDESGKEWDFCKAGFSVNDTVKMTIDNNHSDTIKDDQIKTIKKIRANER